MKTFLKNYFIYRRRQYIYALQDLNYYMKYNKDRSSVYYYTLELQIAWNELLYKFYESLLPKKWIIE